ncbi:MAG TPA: hypothetical protein VIU10_07015 [Candidatus Udaeobacter sp.]
MKINEHAAASDARNFGDLDKAARWAPLDRGVDKHRVMSNRILGNGDSRNGSVAVVSSRRRFPLATLMICFTIWLIATEALFFDQLKFNTRVELLEQTARAFRGPEVIAPTQRAFNFPGGGNAKKL